MAAFDKHVWCTRRTLLKLGASGLVLPWLPGCNVPDAEVVQNDDFPILPYIQSVHDTGFTVLWESAEKAQGRVEVFQQDSEVIVFGANDPASTFHRVAIDDSEFFLPGQQYFYQVKEDKYTVGPVRSFKTAPVDGEDSSFSFVVFGDSGLGNEAQFKVADQMAKRAPDLALHVGDVVYDGFVREYRHKFFDPYRSLVHRCPVYPVLGDHDWGPVEDGSNATAFFRFFALPGKSTTDQDTTYSFLHGNALFIALDTNRVTKGIGSLEEQTSFLEAQLAAYSHIKWKFIYFHKPLLTNGEGRSGFEELAAVLMPLAEQYDVTAVFSGDTHAYERFTRNGVHYIVTGGGGAGLRSLGTDIATDAQVREHHFVQVSLDANTMTLEMIDLDGNLRDSVQKTI